MSLHTKYNKSWALIIGINDYLSAPPLDYARSDAEAIAEILKSRFKFPEKNITLLYDANATKENIMTNFLSYNKKANDVNDRLLVFYAGHGHTITGHRGDVGYLIPVDAKLDDIATYIRWDEFTRNADLIPAKHILFIMDACYGGLAVTRSVSGGTRFIKDMLTRRSRQVLTAGKANEPVADAGGPVPNHSIFTGHLIQALEGKAASPTDETITAQGVMAYVYDKVANDTNSKQTPHFGHVDGDGDFIFSSFVLDNIIDDALQTEQPIGYISNLKKSMLSEQEESILRQFVESEGACLINTSTLTAGVSWSVIRGTTGGKYKIEVKDTRTMTSSFSKLARLGFMQECVGHKGSIYYELTEKGIEYVNNLKKYDLSDQAKSILKQYVESRVQYLCTLVHGQGQVEVMAQNIPIKVDNSRFIYDDLNELEERGFIRFDGNINFGGKRYTLTREGDSYYQNELK